MRLGRPFSTFLLPVLALVGPTLAQDDLQERLRHRLEVLDEPGELVAAGELLFAVPSLVEFYEGRAWLPAWLDGQDRPKEILAHLILALESSRNHGLTPSHYHLEALRSALDRVRAGAESGTDPGRLVDVELLATDAFLTLANHYANGHSDPQKIDPGWFLNREEPELISSLGRAVTAGQGGPRGALRALLPAERGYRVLLERLALQRKLAENGSWQSLDPGRALKPGDTDPAVAAIRHRLTQLGDYEPKVAHKPEHSDVYDEPLANAVRQFQARHGLDQDGIIGRDTLRELNVPPAHRIDQIRANLERWRWLPRSLGDEYIIVNIAGFRMELFSGGERVMEKRAIVGLPYRRTPVFTGRMTYLVFNPSWEVPHRLTIQDKLPEIVNDPEYLSRLGFTVLQGWGAEERLIDPTTVNWSELTRADFPYRLRQAPGPANALGQVKFMFPNEHNVYLHDTPSRGLFAQAERAFSSGCIRLEEPLELAEWLLASPARPTVMTPEEIDRILAGGRETTVPLDRPVTVHLLYWTAWMDDNGTVQFRRDIYGRDAPLIEALNKPPPAH